MSRTAAARQQKLDFLAALMGAEPEGMGLDAISQKLGGTHQRRTLQRRHLMHWPNTKTGST